MSAEARGRRPSLVDGAEVALRDWLSSGRHRPGDHLPPEQDLATMLGVSRGTLRSALQRLEQRGEIVRRQGSGTFVGQLPMPTALIEGLERLESYSSLARRRGLTLSHRNLTIERRPLGSELAETFGLPEDTVAPVLTRLLIVNGRPNAVMTDIVHPDVPLPPRETIDQSLKNGNMVLDILVDHGLPIAFSSTVIRSVLVHPGDEMGLLLGLEETTAAIELEETVHLTTGEAVQRSHDVFGPGGLDLHVIRAFDAAAPTLIASSKHDGLGSAGLRRRITSKSA